MCNKNANFVTKFMTTVRNIYIYTCCLLVFLSACQQQSKKPEVTPWGTTIGENSLPNESSLSLDDIQTNGELIMLTISGPETYYDYHGHGMGAQYLLCQKFADKLGVSLRVEVCKDTIELVKRMQKGEADLAAIQLPRKWNKILYAGAMDQKRRTSWIVRNDGNDLARALNNWFKPDMLEKIKREEQFLLSTASISRHVYAPMLNRAGGVISRYDHLFQRYAPLARWDWRLLAAQCYQESTFDPKARSWAGACGLMQIMPSTADHVGLPRENLYDPEANIACAAKYIQELSGFFRDVPASERIFFVLASYNGGHFHVRDAMALARRDGHDPHRWSEVEPYILKLSSAAYYTSPIVKFGYMRGSETVNYVRRIRERWNQYRGVAKGGFSSGFSTTPERAKRRYKWHL